MINVNQITSQLARMPDQALQQYAQMHKSDPYIMALALSESNRRKQMRSGAQMNAPEQPKVVDQEIQGMASPMPENVGIGQLPAGDMNFADGGIVAFSDGGVPRYQSQGLVDERQYRSQDGQYYARPLTGKTGYEGMGPKEFFGTVYTQALRKLGLEDKKFSLTPAEQRAAEAEANKMAVAQGSEYSPERYGVTAAAPAFVDPRLTGATPPAQTVGAPPAPPPAAPKPDAAPRQRVPAGGPGAAAAPAAGLAALTPMQSPSQMYQSAMETVPLVDPAASQREALGSEMIGGAERRARTLKEDIAKEGDVFAGRGERIGQREAKLKDYESTNQSLALLNAGLAIMSTPGGLATAIGKGARVGTEQYAAGLDKIRAAQERLEDARDNLDALRLNRADMNRKEVRAAEADIDRAKTDAKKLGIEGIMAASDLRHKQASDLFKGTLEQAKTVYTVAGDLQGRQIAANATMAAARAPSGQERMALALGGGNLETGLRKMAEISAGKFDPKKAYTEYLVAAQKMPGTDLLSYSQFVGQFAIPTSPGNNPSAAPGTVRDRP